MINKFEIDSYVEKAALNKNIQSFYPVAIAKSLELPLNVIIDRLYELSKLGYLDLKFEIRCELDLDIIKTVDDVSCYLGKQMYCEECNDYIEITMDNIFPVYYIKQEYRQYVKKNIQNIQNVLIQKNICLNVNENIANLPTIVKEYFGENQINLEMNYNIDTSEIDNKLEAINNSINSCHKEDNIDKLLKITQLLGIGYETFVYINAKFPALNEFFRRLF